MDLIAVVLAIWMLCSSIDLPWYVTIMIWYLILGSGHKEYYRIEDKENEKKNRICK